MGENLYSWSRTAASNSTADASINWAEGQSPSTVNDSARSMMAATAKWLYDNGGNLATGGAADAYTATTQSSFSALATGLTIVVKPHAANTGASTINVDSLGAKSIRKVTSAGEAALAANDLLTTMHAILQYDSAANSAAGAWLYLNCPGGDVTTTGTQTLTNKTLTSPSISSPTLSGTATGTYTLGGTPTISSPTITTPTINTSIAGTAVATAAEYRDNTASKALTTDKVWSAMAEVTLTDAANVSWDMSTGFDFVLTLGGNRTLDNPTNTKVGQKGRLLIIQDATGSRTLALGTSYYTAGAVAPTLSTAANAKDVFYYDVRSSTEIYLSRSIAGAAT